MNPTDKTHSKDLFFDGKKTFITLNLSGNGKSGSNCFILQEFIQCLYHKYCFKRALCSCILQPYKNCLTFWEIQLFCFIA